MYEKYFSPMPRMETDRLIIRRVERSDARELYELCSRPETSQYSLWSPHESLSVTKQYISCQHSLERRGCCTFFVVEEKSGGVIGTASYVSLDESFKIAEIGYSILSDLWGRGYGTEVADALTGFAFDRLGAQRVYARVLPENKASAAVLEKLGFAFEGTQQKGYYYKGRVNDVDIYGMTDDMYFEREAAFNGASQDSQLYR